MGRGGTESFFVLIGLRTVFAKALFLTILVLTQAAIAQTSSPPACVAVPFGAVAWWRAQSNTVDTIGVNDGLPQGARLSVTSYTLGRVGAAFHFPAPILGPPPLVKTTNYIFVPPVPDLDIGQGQGLTVEG